MEVIVVRKDKNFIFAIFKVMAPCLKDFDNSQKLTIVDLILYFC